MTDDIARQRAHRVARDAALDVPNCPVCLHPMAAVETADGSVWRCDGCGLEVASDQ